MVGTEATTRKLKRRDESGKGGENPPTHLGDLMIEREQFRQVRFRQLQRYQS